MAGYSEYYNRTIRENTVGLKLVVGGTGLGKTSAIHAVVRALPSERKAIYIANRLQLLEEMIDRKKGFLPEEVAFLRRDFEVVLNTLGAMRSDLFAFLEDDLFRAYAGRIDIPQLKQSCKCTSSKEMGHKMVFAKRHFTPSIANNFKRTTESADAASVAVPMSAA